MTDVAEIAAGLTKAQHTACWNLGDSHKRTLLQGWMLAPHDGWRRSGQACTNLVKKGLAEKYVEDCFIYYRLTSLGLAVRAHLTRKNPCMTDPHGADSAEIKRLTIAMGAAYIAGRASIRKGKDATVPDFGDRARALLAALRTPPDDAVKLREALCIAADSMTAMAETFELLGENKAAQGALQCGEYARRAALKGTPNDGE